MNDNVVDIDIDVITWLPLTSIKYAFIAMSFVSMNIISSSSTPCVFYIYDDNCCHVYEKDGN